MDVGDVYGAYLVGKEDRLAMEQLGKLLDPLAGADRFGCGHKARTFI